MKQWIERWRKRFPAKHTETQATTAELNHEEEDRTVHHVSIDIPSGTVVRVLFILTLFWGTLQALGQLQSLVITLVITLFIALGLSGPLTKLEQWMPRGLAILCVYILFLGAIGVLFASVVPLMVTQLSQIIQDLISMLQQDTFTLPWVGEIDPSSVGIVDFLREQQNQLSGHVQSFAGSTVDVLIGLFEGLFNLIFSLTLLFFILLEREQVGRFILLLLPLKQRRAISAQSDAIQHKIGQWFQGQIKLMISIGVGMFIGMKVFEYTLDMPYALTIALVAGFMELFPYIGVFITGALALLVAANVSWLLVVLVLGWMALIQFIEGNVLVPLIMKESTGLPSVVVLIALTVGAVLGNALGGITLSILLMILAVPVSASVALFIRVFMEKQRQKAIK